MTNRRATIFVSYRRSDAGGWAGRVHERLTRALGAQRVFMDINSIELGEQWEQRLHDEIAASDIVAVLVGPDWTGVRADGTRRIDDLDDPVRMEVREALAGEAEVVPVVVGGADLPTTSELPDAIRPLLDSNALLLEPSYFDQGIDRLIQLAGGDVRRRRRWLAAAAAGLLAVGGGALVIATRGEPIEAMVGDFNVAVVPFTVLRDGEPVDSGDGEQFADDIATQLDSELERLRSEGFQPQLRRPDELAALEGSTPTERADDAARLATEIDADIVVYGSLAISETGTSLAPEFYLDQKRLFEAAELAGGYELGEPVRAVADASVNPVAAQQLRADLSDQVDGFVDLVFGLSYYSLRDYETAEGLFAGADADFDGIRGREVVLLFLGDSQGRQRRFDEALAQYELGMSLAPDYARLPLSTAEARFQIVAGSAGCQPGSFDDADLADVVAWYERARTADEQPPLADVGLRAGFGVGRVELCRANAGVEADLDRAAMLLADVTTAYEDGNIRIREVASEAYGLQGLLAIGGGDGATEADRTLAIERYGLAAASAVDDDRRVYYENLLAELSATD